MKRFFPSVILVLVFYLNTGSLAGQHENGSQYFDHPWVDSMLNSLSAGEKLAQALWVRTAPDEGLSELLETAGLVRDQGLGGLIITAGSRVPMKEMTGYLRTISSIPPLLAMEGGWGKEYPDKLSLAAIGSDSLRYLAGLGLALHFKELGVDLLLMEDLDDVLASALRDGNILVLDPARIRSVSFSEVANSINKQIQADSVDRMARQVLALKYRIKQQSEDRKKSVDEKPGFHRNGQSAFIRDLYAHSLTVLNNREGLIPLRDLERTRIACLAVNQEALTDFQKMAAMYSRTDNYFWNAGAEDNEKLIKKLSTYDLVLTGLYPGHSMQETEKFLSLLMQQTKVILSCFSDPASMEVLEGMLSGSENPGPGGLILAYRQNPLTEKLWVQLVFGAIEGRGRLPFAIGDRYQAGQGISTPGGLRLQYGFAENAGLCSTKLNFAIDSIVNRGLEAAAYPGCQVIVARKGIVVFHKAYGHHSYDRRIGVRKHDLYDLASVTKISGPLSGLMLLEGMGKFSHLDQLGDYSGAMKGSDKASLELKDVLAHRAGLFPWIAYHEKTLKKDGRYKKRFIRTEESGKYTDQVADRLYLSNTFREKKIFKEIRKSELGEQKYLYSGLSFFLFPTIIEGLSGEPYETFLSEHIYRRLGAWELLYRPSRFFPASRIVPTEYDSLFRKQLIHGYVHDEGAALMGAYAGNAGLFASANDLLKLIEMYRRMGSYGGEQIIEEKVLREYSSYQFPELEIRRGLGFDKPLLNQADGTARDYPCPGASPASFGHSGFTGTFVWADPEHEISYVFLSNRVHPTRQNGLLYDLDIRTSILQSVYDSIIEP